VLAAACGKHQEHVKEEVRLVKPGDAAVVPDDLVLAVVGQKGLQKEGEEEPSAPDGVPALGGLPAPGLGSAAELGLGAVDLRAEADVQHVVEVLLPGLVDVGGRCAGGRHGVGAGADADGASDEGLHHDSDGAVVRRGEVARQVHGEERAGAMVAAAAVLHGQGGDEVFPHGC